MVTRFVLPWVVLAACTGCMAGPNTETKIDDLRVVAVVLEPPEVSAGDTLAVDVTVADPEENGVELLFWTCTDPFYAGECLEANLPVAQWVWEGKLDAGHWTHALDIPSSLGAWFAKGFTEIPVTIWALACEPGLCDLFEEVRQGDPGLSARLASPNDILRGLPFEGVSLARRQAWVSGREPGERNENPVATPLFDADVLEERARGVELDFGVSESEVDAYGFAEAGGFAVTDARTVEGEVRLTWLPPEKGLKEPARVYVTFEDGEGGSALWEGTIQPKNGRN